MPTQSTGSTLRWGDLRAALLRDHHQLHRPAGHRHPEARSPEGDRLERDRVLEHRLGLQPRLRDQPPVLGRLIDRIGTLPRLRRSPWCCGASPPWRTALARTPSGLRRSPASRSASAKAATSRPRSRPWPSGSRKKERAFATGLFNAGTNIGAIVTPLAIPWIVVHWGWRCAFVAHRRHRLPLARRLARVLPTARGAPAALARPSARYIRSDPPEVGGRDRALGEPPSATGRPGPSRWASS